jgi:hypothetical protein
MILRLQKMAVVRGHERKPELTPEGRELRNDRELLGDPVILNLEVETPFTEDGGEALGEPARLRAFVGEEQPRDAALEAAAQGDKPLSVGGEKVEVNARAVVKPLEKGDR